TEERLKEVDFSDPYFVVQQKVMVRKEDKKRFKTTADFNGLSVGAQKQTTQEDLVKNEMTGAEPTSLQKVPDLINNLLNNKVEAVVLEQPVAEAYVQQSDNLALAPVKFEQGEKVTAIAMSKNTPELKKHVNGSIKTINDKNLLK